MLAISSTTLLLLTLLTPSLASKPKTPNHLTATALTTSPTNTTVFQCWLLHPAFTLSSGAGTVGASNLPLGNFTDVEYTVIPPRFSGGRHNAPFKQIVVFISGLANITLPTSSEFAVVHGGANGLIIAMDTEGEGHITTYPSEEATVSLQMPFTDGVVAGHCVLHHGACTGKEVIYD